MDKVLNFIKSPLGKFLIIAIVVVIVGYFSLMQYQKSIYGGKTKSEVKEKIKSDFGNWYLNTKMANDLALEGKVISAGMVDWYDKNAAVELSSSSISNTLNSLGIEASLHSNFSDMAGQKVLLAPYYSE